MDSMVRRQKVPLKDATPRAISETQPLNPDPEHDDDLVGEDIMTSNHPIPPLDPPNHLQETSPLASNPIKQQPGDMDISLSSSEPSLFPPSPPRVAANLTGFARGNAPPPRNSEARGIPQDITPSNHNRIDSGLSDVDLDAIQADLEFIQNQFAPLTRKDTDYSYASSMTDRNKVEEEPSPEKSADGDQNNLEVIGNQFVPLTRKDTDRSFASSMVSDSEGDEGGSRERRGSMGSGLQRLRRRKRASTFTDEEMKNIPRLVHRNLPFKQSRQEIAVVNKTIFRSLKLQRILSQDWYHVFLRQPTIISLGMMLFMWTFWIIIFALVYMNVDRRSPDVDCGLGQAGKPIKFETAFAFSLETCTTVGYGLPNGTNGFFETECKELQVAIYFQMIWSMVFNAFLFSFVFARLARCESRGAQVLFSDKAIIEKRDGKWMMHVRIYDFDSAQPVVEAHVRMYCVSWRDYERQTRDLVQPHLLHVMRILQPNDDLGATMFTSIPANVTHRIDAFSPLAPIRYRRRLKMLGVGGSSGLSLREVDQDVGARSGVICPVCGESYSSMFHLRRHIQYTSMQENADPSFPMQGSHRDTNIITPDLFKPLLLSEEDIRDQLRDKEIMVVVEGIERKSIQMYDRYHSLSPSLIYKSFSYRYIEIPTQRWSAGLFKLCNHIN